MNETRAQALALRQAQLLARSALLRQRLGEDLAPWQPRLARVDQARALASHSWQWLRQHPEVPAAAAGLLLVLRPKRALALAWRWGRRGWLGWQLWRRVQHQAQAQGVDLAALLHRR